MKQNKLFFSPKKVVHLFIAHELDTWSIDLNHNSTPEDSLFGAVKLTKNTYQDNCSYSGYGIGFDSCSLFYFQILIDV